MIGPCACCVPGLQQQQQQVCAVQLQEPTGMVTGGCGPGGTTTVYLLTPQHQPPPPMAMHQPAPAVLHPTVTYAAPINRGALQTVSYGPPNPLFGGMEAVWHCEFQKLFAQFYSSHSQVWFLIPVAGPPAAVRGWSAWHPFLDSAKVRFCCQDCGHGWTSMKGRVAFWFSFNSVHQEGHIAFKLYGQKCQRCKTENYENAMWYPEEVSKVMVNLFHRIGYACYGLYQASYAKNRRPGKPRTPHNSDLCQACQDGICSERR